MDSLLVNLRKYRPRENTDPLENFVTEAFAWLLRSSDEVMKEVWVLMNEHLSVPVPSPTSEVTISTQENFNNKFPDMVFSWSGWLLVFEHKTWSELHTNQLSNYRSYAADMGSDYRIVLITAKKSQHRQSPDAALCWEQIYKKLEIIQDRVSDDKISWAIKDFLKLLKSEGLGPSTPINTLALAYYKEAIALDEQLKNISLNTKTLSWPLLSQKMEPHSKSKRWGRIGLEFNTLNDAGKPKWEPGLFCGFMVDHSDHVIPDLMKKGLICAVVLDLNKWAQKKYQENEDYKNLVIELTAYLAKYHPDWQVSDRHAPGVPLNKWHPLLITKTIECMFEHAHTNEEQEAAFFTQVSDIQKALLCCPSFIKLKDELRTLAV